MLPTIIVVAGVFVLIGAIAVVSVVSIYNRLVTLRNRYQNAYSQVDVQAKRRYDLIPNLVETVKGYMAHERGTLEAVMAARNSAQAANATAAASPGDPTAMRGVAGAETALTGALGRLFAVVENYPDLKAEQNVSQLMEELTSTENKIGFARQAFNDSAMGYNTACQVFPAVIVANVCGFRPATLYQIESPQEREAPKVSFST